MTISIVLYGRNDSYGYNLHKRAALSLNCMAEVLIDPSDEILFVDYNTPDDFPTFPEAIQDTLTKRARDILRIFRVRPWVHQRFKSNTHLVALEPIARNVAVRRSCPDNRWILSTNTDMIFVPRGADSLSTIAQRLAPGFYHAPRIEIPEVLWEGLDRHAPAGVITTVRDWGSMLHLNEIILGAEFILYDGPGDFQLLLRDDLFENHGFHEEMLLGWHVDSNIAKRMYLKYGTVGDLGPEVYGYHCDHTRQVTPAHSHARLQNDWRRFCDQVDSPDVPEQASTWGCANDTIEEVRLLSNPSGVYVQALREAIGSPLIEPQVTKYTLETYNRTDYDPKHMVPFLADMFASMPRSSDLAWFGAGSAMLRRFATVWARLGFTGRILVDPEMARGNDLNDVSSVDRTSKAFNSADAFVFDFGGLPGASRDPAPYQQVSKQLLQRFLEVVREERSRLSTGLPPRRVIALNAINNQFERLVAGYVAAAVTPCATHMRHGFVLPAKAKDDWLPLLQIGAAGVRVGSRIKSDPHKLGVIAHGPYKYLDAGRYRLSLKAELLSDQSTSTGNDPCITIIVHAGAEVFGSYALCRSALLKPDHEFVFFVPDTVARSIDGIETRIILLSRVAVSIEAETIESLAMNSKEIAETHNIFSPPAALKIDDWLPYLSLGALGRIDDGGIYAQKGPSDFVVFGPYWPLPAGHYEMAIAIESMNEGRPGKHLVRADVVSGEEWLSGANFYLGALPSYAGSPIRVPFRIDGNTSECRLIETRLWSSGEERFWIRSLSVQPLDQSRRRDFLPFLLPGEIGRRLGNHVSNVDSGSGLIAYSPTIRVKSGGYRIDLAVEFGRSERAHRSNPGCALMLVKHGYEVLGVDEITAGEGQTKEQALLFEVPANQGPDSGLELFFLVVGGARITLRKLSLEPTERTIDRGIPAVLGFRNLLPILQTGSGARVEEDTIAVGKGEEGFAVFGPFWTFPPGRYEMLAVVVPGPHIGDHGAFVTAQVTGEHGTRVFVEEQLRLDQYNLNKATAIEFRLPFSLSHDLSAATRTIETRIFTTGKVGFRILSLAVTASSEQPAGNWFPYLLVRECGVHTGSEIRSITNKIGCIASTPPMQLVPGHYKVSPEMTVEGGPPDDDSVAFEVWFGSDLIALVTANSRSNQPLEFDVTKELSETGVALRICAIAPVAFSVRGLTVEKNSDAIEPRTLPAVWELRNWLPFLRLGPAGLRVDRDVTASQGQNGYVVYGPYWPLPAGEYVMQLAVELKEPAARSNRNKLDRTFASLRTLIRGRNANTAFDGGADIMFDGRQIAVVEGFTIGSLFSQSALVRLTFKIPFNDANPWSPVETRVWSTGARSFLIRSLTLERLTPNDKT